MLDEAHGSSVKLYPIGPPSVTFDFLILVLRRVIRISGVGLALVFLLGGCYTDSRKASSHREKENQRAIRWKADMTYAYAPDQVDLSAKAIFGTSGDLVNWQKLPTQRLRQQASEIQKNFRIRLASRKQLRNELSLITNDTYIVESNVLSSPLAYTITRWTPLHKAMPGPVIVAFDGHGDCGGECSGKAPERMFKPGGFGRDLVQRGWTVIGFPTAIHKPLSSLNRTYDFPLIWAALATQVFHHAKASSPSDHEHVIYLGNAIGGLTAAAASIIDPHTTATVTNGAFFPLDFTRTHYRIKDHSLCHDMREFASYVPFYALIYPLPLMIQVGEEDGLWLGHGPVEPSGWYSGLPRGATSDETVGAALLLQRLWTRTGKTFSLDVHPGGHEDLDALRADKFLRPLVSGLTMPRPLNR